MFPPLFLPYNYCGKNDHDFKICGHNLYVQILNIYILATI